MTITVQYSTSTAEVSKLICKVSHSPFSHVDIVYPDGLYGASNSPDAPVIRGIREGVALRPFDYQEFGIRRRAIIDVPPDVEKKFYENLESQLWKPFDGAGLHAFLNSEIDTGRQWDEASVWFCSELFIWCLRQAGAFKYTLLVSKHRISPADSLLIINPYMTNVDTFWNSIQGITLGRHER